MILYNKETISCMILRDKIAINCMILQLHDIT